MADKFVRYLRFIETAMKKILILGLLMLSSVFGFAQKPQDIIANIIKCSSLSTVGNVTADSGKFNAIKVDTLIIGGVEGWAIIGNAGTVDGTYWYYVKKIKAL